MELSLANKEKYNSILLLQSYISILYYIVLQRIYGKTPVGRAASVWIDVSVDREALAPLSPSSRTSAFAAIITGKQSG